MVARPKPVEEATEPLRNFRVIEGDFDESQVGEAIHRLKESFLECRTIGHAWKLNYIGPSGRADEEIQRQARNHPTRPDGARVLKCGRCRTERVDLCWVGYGLKEYAYRMVARYYRYPDDYKVEGAMNYRYLMHEELFRRFEGGK